MKKTTLHHGRCIMAQAWDVSDPLMQCSCPRFWPRRVCANCLESPKQCHCVDPAKDEPGGEGEHER